MSDDQLAEYSAGAYNGSTIQPVYQQRFMKCIVVTESELKQLGLANIGITAFASIGSFFAAFAVDVMKDVWLAPSVPENARALVDFVQPAGIWLAVMFYFLTGVTVWWRSDMLRLIKKESSGRQENAKAVK